MKRMTKRLIWLVGIVTILAAACRQTSEQSSISGGVVTGKICFPSDSIPEMNLYFQPVGEDRVISYPVHEGQQEYSLELAPGTYHAYVRLSTDLLGGGMYSEAVPCGLEVGCGHELLSVEVFPGEETGGVDVCDWYAPPGEVPLPPGLVEDLIVRFWQKDHPDFSGETPLALEELTMDGQPITMLSVRLFRVVEGPLENETFLIRYDGLVVRLGVSDGGQGVSSLALSDLDGDGTSELYYSYSFGSGIHQSHLGVYAPAYDTQGIFEADAYYLGDLALFSDEPGQVGVRVVEANPETLTIKYLDTLGTLDLEQVDGQVQLKFNQVEGLSGDVQELIIYPEGSREDSSQLWRTVEDPHHGVRFAVPCFWEVGILETPPPTDAYAYPIRNYTDTYANSFGKNKEPLWESGAIKIDMDFLSGSNWNLSPEASPEDLLAALYDEGSNLSVLDVEKEVINGQEGLLVTAESTFDGEVQFYLFKVSDQLFLIFGPRKGTLNDPDVQAILGSLALRPEVEVNVPRIVPGDAPDGQVPECMQGMN